MATRPGLIVTRAVELVHEHGNWCRTCLLATAVRFVVGYTVNDHPTSVGIVLRCTECGGSDIEVDPDADHC